MRVPSADAISRPPADAISRRALASLAALALSVPRAPPAAHAIFQATMEPAKYFGTASGLIYFDEPIGSEAPPKASYSRLWIEPQLEVDNSPQAPVVNAPGTPVIIDYRIRRDGFTGEIVALSDGPGNGGSVRFVVGDRSVNPAVDEMVRTLKPQVLRRAVVPAKFDLDRGTRSTYPREAPPGTTYLEVNIRRVLASNAVGVCDGATDETSLQAAKVATPLCASGRTEKYGMFEVDLDRVPGGRPTNDFSDL